MLKRVVLGGLLLTALMVAGSAARAVHGYFTGTAVIMFSGYPGRTGWNLDPFSRVPYRSRGCRVPSFEPLLVHLPNNLALDLLAASFGPMPGSYHGPYPSREEAARLLREAPVVFSRLAGNEWPPGADCATVRAALQPDDGPPAGFARMRCTVFEGETLITGDAHEARLFDRKTGKRYTLYMLPLPETLELDGIWSGHEKAPRDSGGTRIVENIRVTFHGSVGTHEVSGTEGRPLTVVGRKGNAVEFEVVTRNQPRRYAGAWNGEAITGTVGQRTFSLWPAL